MMAPAREVTSVSFDPSPGPRIVNNSTFAMGVLFLLFAMTISFFVGHLGPSAPPHLYQTKPGLASTLSLLSPMPIDIHHNIEVVMININSGMYLSKTKQKESFTNATIFQLVQVQNQPNTYIFRISGSNPTQVLTVTQNGLEISPLDGYHGSNFQYWKIETHSTASHSKFKGLSYLQISSVANGKVLEVSKNSKQENSEVILGPPNNPLSDNQHWVIVPTDIELAIENEIEYQRRQEQQKKEQNRSQTETLTEFARNIREETLLKEENNRLMTDNANLKKINADLLDKTDQKIQMLKGIASAFKKK